MPTPAWPFPGDASSETMDALAAAVAANGGGERPCGLDDWWPYDGGPEGDAALCCGFRPLAAGWNPLGPSADGP